MQGDVGSLGQELAREPVGVFVRAAPAPVIEDRFRQLDDDVYVAFNADTLRLAAPSNLTTLRGFRIEALIIDTIIRLVTRPAPVVLPPKERSAPPPR